MSWGPSHITPHTIAAGLGTGRVILTSLSSASQESDQPFTKEFLPRNPRACNAVAWNHNLPHLLAAGLEKARDDFSTLVWDVNTPGNDVVSNGPSTRNLGVMPTPSVSMASSGGSNTNTSGYMHTLHLGGNRITRQVSNTFRELNKEAVTQALAWHPQTPLCLATGHNLGHLILHDLRGPQSTSTSVQRAHPADVCGVQFNPFFSDQLATFSTSDVNPNQQSTVKLWDTRKLSTELFVAIESRKITQISWCPTRVGILGACCVSTDPSTANTSANYSGNIVRIWDVKSSFEILELSDLTKRKKRVQIFQDAINLCGKEYTIDPSITTGPLDPTLSWNWGVDNDNFTNGDSSSHSGSGYCGVGYDDCILVGSSSGQVELVRVAPVINVSCGPLGSFAVASNRVIHQLGTPNPATQQKNIPELMHTNNNINNNQNNKLPITNEYDTENKSNTDQAQLEKDILLRGHGDISNVMLQRVKAGYSSDAKKNFEEVVPAFSNEELLQVWKWIYKMKYKYNANGKTITEFGGLFKLLQESKGQDTVHSTGFGYPMYFSKSRSIAGRLSGWGFKDADQLEQKLIMCEKIGDISKATALSIFHCNIKRALFSLQSVAKKALIAATPNGGNLNFEFVAMALSGYQQSAPDVSNSASTSSPTISSSTASSSSSSLNLWKTTVKGLLSQISDPYLQAVFLFLCHDVNKPTSISTDSIEKPYCFQELLQIKGIDLNDRIGFACRYLPYDDLMRFLASLQSSVIDTGDLKGLLITGLSMTVDSAQAYETSVLPGLRLLENYLQKTSDLQTVALLLSQVPKRISKPSSQHQLPSLASAEAALDELRHLNLYDKTIHIYRELLDRWELWYDRAKFDINRIPNASDVLSGGNHPFVSAGCKYCGHSFTLGKDPTTIGGSSAVSLQPGRISKPRTTSCPNCSNSLPKCSVCLLPFEVTTLHSSNIIKEVIIENSLNSNQLSWASNNGRMMDDWFCWCQSCKHGGHMSHLANWFSTHDTCPVTNCDCSCYSL